MFPAFVLCLAIPILIYAIFSERVSYVSSVKGQVNNSGFASGHLVTDTQAPTPTL
jgi:hypothetical protein